MPSKRRGFLVIPSKPNLTNFKRESDIAKCRDHGCAGVGEVGTCMGGFCLKLLNKGLHFGFGFRRGDVATLYLRDEFLFLLARAQIEFGYKRGEGHSLHIVVQQAVHPWVSFTWFDGVIAVFPNKIRELGIGLGHAENLFGKSFGFGLVSRGLGGRIGE